MMSVDLLPARLAFERGRVSTAAREAMRAALIHSRHVAPLLDRLWRIACEHGDPFEAMPLLEVALARELIDLDDAGQWPPPSRPIPRARVRRRGRPKTAAPA